MTDYFLGGYFMNRILRNRLYVITFGFVIFSLALNFVMQRFLARENFYKSSQAVFTDIEYILRNNEAVIEAVKRDFKETCRLRAKVAATYIDADKSILYSANKAQELADLLRVDEIHIFDESGTIFGGNMPIHYGLNVNSGEQIAYFKDMITNKELELVQDLTPRTFDGKRMQYAAAWMPCKKHFVQIGREPRWLEQVLERTSLSDVFNNIVLDDRAHIFALNVKTNVIIASTDTRLNDQNIIDYGFTPEDMKAAEEGLYHVSTSKKEYFLVMDKDVINNNIRLGKFIRTGDLYEHVDMDSVILIFYLFLGTLIVTASINYFIKYYVVDEIEEVNEGLTEITKGNLNTKLNVSATPEFKELSNHINEMVESLKGNTRRAFEMCNKLNVPIGLYEYRNEMKHVSITGNLAEILGLDDKEHHSVFANKDLFEERINQIKENIIVKDHGIYKLPWADKYVRFEQEVYTDVTIGIVVDVTESYNEISNIARERDVDAMTGMLNRRSFFEKLEEVFQKPEEIGWGGMFFIDANRLKYINDAYGHKVGDMYICAIADMVKNAPGKKKVCCRYGGDEFIAFVYGAESKIELLDAFDEVMATMDNSFIEHEGEKLRISFTVGAAFYPEHDTNYHALITLADENMYENKGLGITNRNMLR